MGKKVLVIVLILAVIAAAIVFGVMKFKGGLSSNKAFGKETYKLLDEGKYILACNDAKSLVKMIVTMNEDFAKNPELAGATEISKDNQTESMKLFEATMDNFTNTLEGRYKDNRSLRDQVFAGVGEGFSNIFQLTIMLHLGMVKVEQVNEYVDIKFCDKQAPANWVSPLEQASSPMGESDVTVKPDNSTTK